MLKRVLCAVIITALVAPWLALDSVVAQDDNWTCDEGPNDILNAAQAAYDEGDLEVAYDLATQATTVCATNILRSVQATQLLGQIETARSLAEAEQSAATFADVPYMPDGEIWQDLDIYLPEGTDDPVPTVVIFPTLDFNNKEDYELEAICFAEAGYIAVAVDVKRPVVGDLWRSMQDGFCALAWVHANAEAYGFDPQRTVVVGMLFGGQLAGVIGTLDDPALFMDECPYPVPEHGWAQGIVLWFPKIHTAPATSGFLQSPFMQLHYGFEADEWVVMMDALAEMEPTEWRNHEWPEEYLRVLQTFPLYWVDGSEPPFMIYRVSGQPFFDTIAPTRQVKVLHAALDETGVEVTLVLEGMVQYEIDGSIVPEQREEIAQLTVEFIDGLFAESAE
jgi:acetyl esterase/lipase